MQIAMHCDYSTFKFCGSIGRSSKTWTPIPRIVDILESALELSFDAIEPTGKVFMHAVDISGEYPFYFAYFKSEIFW